MLLSVLWQPIREKNWKENTCVYVCVCVHESLCFKPEINTTLKNNSTSILKSAWESKKKKKEKMRSKNSIACWIKHFECFQVIFLKNIIIKWNYAFISLIFHKRIVQAFLCIMCYWRLVKHIEYSAIMGLWCTMVILLEAMFSFEFFLIEINPLYPHLSLDSFYFYFIIWQ